MPADGRRKKLVVGVRDAIKAATGADYFNDLSTTGLCELGRETDQSMLEGAQKMVIRVFDGREQTRISGASDYMAELEVLVAIMLKDSTRTLVERMCDLLADINLAIGRGSALGGACTTMRIGSIDPPEYEEETAYTVVRIAATYDYVAGVDR